MPAPPTDPTRRPGPDSARRRAVLLALALALPTLLVLSGVGSAWPLLALPLAVAYPLSGVRGLAAASATAAAVVALASGDAAVAGPELAVGLAAFVGAAGLVAAFAAARERELERMTALGTTDRLTGLANYAQLAEALPRARRRAARYDRPLSLVVIDIDRFKAFNDRHGHEAGNRLLAAVGRRIADAARASDLVGRYGGEEFVLIVPGPVEEAAEAADRMRSAIADVRLSVGLGEEVGVTASAGVAAYDPALDGDGRAALERADAALYDSKAAGRDTTTVRALPARAPRPVRLAA